MSFSEGFNHAELEGCQTSGDRIDTCSDLAKDINWAELPSLAVERIYSFLSRTEQSRMSQVCSRWSHEFESPAIWKNIKFVLPKYNCDFEIYPEVRFARKYGHMFRHVKIICYQVNPHLIGVTRTQMENFLEALVASSQLTSIEFRNLDYLYDFEAHEGMLKLIISFFNSQRNLKKVVLGNIGLRIENSMKLLKGVFHSNCDTVSNLEYSSRHAVESRKFSNEYELNLEEVCRKFVTVRSLALDYNLMFEDIIGKVYETLICGKYQLDKPCLSKIEIYCPLTANVEFPILRGIQPRTWSYLKRVLPGLKVTIDIFIPFRLDNRMEKILVREMPLSALRLFHNYSAANDIRELITNLQDCSYQNYLESLHLEWFAPIADFARSIIPFVQSCQKLEILHLHVEYMPNGIEGILEELLQNHPVPLKKLHLHFNKLPEARIDLNLEAYNLLFGLQGMDFFLFVWGM